MHRRRGKGEDQEVLPFRRLTVLHTPCRIRLRSTHAKRIRCDRLRRNRLPLTQIGGHSILMSDFTLVDFYLNLGHGTLDTSSFRFLISYLKFKLLLLDFCINIVCLRETVYVDGCNRRQLAFISASKSMPKRSNTSMSQLKVHVTEIDRHKSKAMHTSTAIVTSTKKPNHPTSSISATSTYLRRRGASMFSTLSTRPKPSPRRDASSP